MSTGVLVHTTCDVATVAFLAWENDAHIELGRTPGGRLDCFYGWMEEQEPGLGCLQHHVVTDLDVEGAEFLAALLKGLGHQVVITTLDADGNDAVRHDLPFLYHDGHTH